MKHVLRTVGCAATLALAGALATEAEAGSYTFETIVSVGDTIDGVTLTRVGEVALSDNGQIAFIGHNATGNAVFTRTSRVAGTGSTIGGYTLGYVAGTPSINDSGEVAFYAAGAGFSGTFTSSSAVGVSGQTIDGKTLRQANSNPSLNNNGDVAYVAFYTGGLYHDAGVFVNQTLRVAAGDLIDGHVIGPASDPSINSSGEVAFHSAYGGQHGVFTTSGAVALLYDTVDGYFIDALGSPVINDDGQVAYVARLALTDRKWAVMVNDTIRILEGDTIDGVTINNNGHVPFAQPDLNSSGSIAVRAKPGYVITDTEVLSPYAPDYLMSSPRINNAGQIVFRYRDDIILATPIGAVPTNLVAQLITGSPVTLTQSVDVGATAADLTFDYQFASGTGFLDILLGGSVLGTINAPGVPETGFTSHTLNIGSPFLNMSGLDLEFRFDGPTGSILNLDNIAFPGVVNGGFTTDLNGWQITTTGSGSINAAPSPVPEPSSLALFGLGAVGFAARRRRKRLAA